ncbi:hypothetical protein BWK59_13700 [Flavobacterium davisii]|uniref:Uncharacterized protein n=1 Tax=Flavobacterium davisii TaxID=2906077 RepID=A0A246GFC6_9FLAO|nr:hypothetical protein [Flavobacterium davisii]OWP82848.1 hypothetical protein BWK59_13700 [Flavobacterium davisii]
MKKLFILSSFLLLFINCKKTEKKNQSNINKVSVSNNCNLNQVQNEILGLDEIIKQNHFIDSISNHKKGISLISDSLIVENKTFYQIKAGYNSDIRFETYFTFNVEKGNCENIKVLEPAEGNMISLSEWRELNKSENNIQNNTMSASEMVNLPFDFEEMTKLCGNNEKKCKEKYPFLEGNELDNIKRLISENSEDSPDKIFKINNGNLDFKNYIYCTYGDSDSQTLISVRNDKIISTASIGYTMPDNESYQSFIFEKDLSIIIYDIKYNTFTKKILEKYQVKKDGTILKLK